MKETIKRTFLQGINGEEMINAIEREFGRSRLRVVSVEKTITVTFERDVPDNSPQPQETPSTSDQKLEAIKQIRHARLLDANKWHAIDRVYQARDQKEIDVILEAVQKIQTPTSTSDWPWTPHFVPASNTGVPEPPAEKPTFQFTGEQVTEDINDQI